MPRIAEARPPAEPVSAEQKDRYRRILVSAAKHGSEKGLDRVQMLEVAKDAGVAIATLYRYFPSKTHLFTALLRTQVVRLDAATADPDPQEAVCDAVAAVLVRAFSQLLSRPLLAQAMLQSNSATIASEGGGDEVDHFGNLIFRTARISEPSERDVQIVRLVEVTWYGILISCLNGHITPETAEADTVLACRLLLAGF